MSAQRTGPQRKNCRLVGVQNLKICFLTLSDATKTFLSANNHGNSTDTSGHTFQCLLNDRIKNGGFFLKMQEKKSYV